MFLWRYLDCKKMLPSHNFSSWKILNFSKRTILGLRQFRALICFSVTFGSIQVARDCPESINIFLINTYVWSTFYRFWSVTFFCIPLWHCFASLFGTCKGTNWICRRVEGWSRIFIRWWNNSHCLCDTKYLNLSGDQAICLQKCTERRTAVPPLIPGSHFRALTGEDPSQTCQL